MQRRRLGIWLLLLSFLGMTFLPGCLGRPQRKPGPGVPGTRPQVIGFYEKGWGGFHVGSWETFQAHADKIDTISPFWHSVDKNGELVDDKFEKDVLDFAHSHKINVVTLINNKKYPEGDNGAFLRDEGLRKKVVDKILALVEKNDYDGVNIDFELLKPDLKEALIDFIDKLAAGLHGKKKILAVSVFPQVDVAQEISAAYDYASLGKAADYLVLMAYDKHYEESPPGPVAPLKWTEDNVNHALKYVPAKKLALAIGSYGYDWPPGGKGEYIPTGEALKRAEKASADIQWDEASQQPFFTYSVGGEKHEVWFQNAASVKQKIDLAIKKQLAAIALWRLGFEEAEVWNIIKSELKR